MKVLVTGASGMLGGRVALALAGAGHDVTVLQRRPSGLPLREVLADVADADAVRAAAHGSNAVVHLAARVSMTGAWRLFEAANVEGTRNVVRAARHAGAGRFVMVSSPSVAHHGAPLVGATAGPADPRRARGPYARSKALAEQLALASAGPELCVVAVRPHLVWGPGDTQLVGRIVDRARHGRLALVGGGRALIDSTYVDNAVEALTAALEHAPEISGTALVVSNGEPRPVGELLTRIARAGGAPPPRHHLPVALAWTGGGAAELAWRALRRPDEPPLTRFLAEQLSTAHWFDQRRTRALLHWQPSVPLDEGFERLAAWYRDLGSVPRGTSGP